MKTSFKEKILITQGVTLTGSTEKHHFIQIMKRYDTKENYITYLHVCCLCYFADHEIHTRMKHLKKCIL